MGGARSGNETEAPSGAASRAENQTTPRPTLPAHLRTIVDQAFQQRRKQLRNSLGADYPFPAGFDPMRRPETLSPAEWITLSGVA